MKATITIVLEPADDVQVLDLVSTLMESLGRVKDLTLAEINVSPPQPAKEPATLLGPNV